MEDSVVAVMTPNDPWRKNRGKVGKLAMHRPNQSGVGADQPNSFVVGGSLC